MDHHATVAAQFDPAAGAYLASDVHAHGGDLAWLSTLASTLETTDCVVDLGCGAGHASYALAAGPAAVFACDLAPAMLATVAQTARRRGLSRLRTCRCTATELPFARGSIALVATRYSAHHWTRPQQALSEIRRVLRPGARLCLIDVMGPEGPDALLLDTHLQALELLRDRSHLKDHALQAWRNMLAAAGFEPGTTRRWRLPIRYHDWLERMRTPPLMRRAVHDLIVNAPQQVRDYYHVDPATLDFELEAAGLVACAS